MFEYSDDAITVPTEQPEQRRTWQQGTTWNKADDDFLKLYWESGKYSSSIIGRMMLPPRTRNAIIGRAHRLGLAKKKNPSHGAPSVHRPYHPEWNYKRGYPQKPRVRKRVIVAANVTTKKAPVVTLPLFADDPSRYPYALPFNDTQHHHCRAIVDETGGIVVCCGHEIHQGQNFSFCAYHLSRFTYHPRRYR